MAGKMTVLAVASIVAVMGYLSTYQTDAEAQQYQQQHGKELTSFRIEQLESRIAEYERELLKEDLSEKEEKWLRGQIARLERKIQCILDGKC